MAVLGLDPYHPAGGRGIIRAVLRLPAEAHNTAVHGARAIDGSDSRSRELPATDDEARRAVEAVLRGDRDAFRPLIERESASVVRTCYRVLGNMADAEDAAQETFVTAFRALGTWRSDGPFGAWLGRIAVRVALRAARQRGTRRELSWLEPPLADGYASGYAGVTASGLGAASGPSLSSFSPLDAAGFRLSDDPAGMVLRSERADQVRSALSRLEDPYREVLALRFFADLSISQIATETGRPIPTVKTHLRRGLLRLRERLEELP